MAELEPKASLISLKARAKVIFFFLGALNNLCVEMTLCYSKDLAKSFGRDNLLTLFHCVMIFCAIATRLFHARFFLKVRHRSKNLVVVLCFALGVSAMVFAFWQGLFVLTLVCMFFFGVGTSLGETNNLGFLKGFPPAVSAGYNSGTGFSGLVGTSFYLLLKLFHFSFYAVNGSILLFYPLYVLAFHFACVYKKRLDDFAQSNRFFQGDSFDTSVSLLRSQVEEEQAGMNSRLSLRSFKALMRACKGLFLSFFALYLLEYVSNSWLTAHIVAAFSAEYPKGTAPFWVTYGFELASVSYRFFLFLGRSSALLFRVSRLKTCLALLTLLVAAYFLQALTGALLPLWSMFGLLSLIAAVGGIIFSNVIFALLETSAVDQSNRETAMNLLGTFGESGMLVSTVLGLIFLRMLPKV